MQNTLLPLKKLISRTEIAENYAERFVKTTDFLRQVVDHKIAAGLAPKKLHQSVVKLEKAAVASLREHKKLQRILTAQGASSNQSNLEDMNTKYDEVASQQQDVVDMHNSILDHLKQK